jgi:hypothetical protein
LRGGYSASSEVVLVKDLTADDSVSAYLRKRVQVLYAGALAEALINGRVHQENSLEYIRIGGAIDYAKARELIHLIRNIEFGATENNEIAQTQLDKLDLELWNQAAGIVEQKHAFIEGLGSRLASEVKHIGTLYTISETELSTLSNFGE